MLYDIHSIVCQQTEPLIFPVAPEKSIKCRYIMQTMITFMLKLFLKKA